MADATDDEVLLDVAPELVAVEAPRRQRRIEFMRGRVREGLGQYALALAVAHELTLAQRAAASGGAVAAGPIVSESEGQLSRTYANNGGSLAGGDAYWGSTQYGLMYLNEVRAKTFTARNRQV